MVVIFAGVVWANQSTRGDKHRPTGPDGGWTEGIRSAAKRQRLRGQAQPPFLLSPPQPAAATKARLVCVSSPSAQPRRPTRYVQSSLSFFFVLLKNVSYLLSSVRSSFIVRNLKGSRQITSFWADEMD